MLFVRLHNNRSTNLQLPGYADAKKETATFFSRDANAAICEEIQQANGKHVYQVKDRTHKIIFQLKES